MKKLLTISLVTVLTIFLACSSSTNDENQSSRNDDNREKQKKKSISEQMEESFITLEEYGECDEDAMEDTIHEFWVAYINSSEVSDSSLFVDFKIIDSCCLDHFGLYTVRNDTLVFDLIRGGGSPCDCQCWYSYKLRIENISEPYTAFQVVL